MGVSVFFDRQTVSLNTFLTRQNRIFIPAAFHTLRYLTPLSNLRVCSFWKAILLGIESTYFKTTPQTMRRKRSGHIFSKNVR